MLKFYGSKFLQYAILLIVTITLNFMLPRLMPGDPLKYIVGEDITLMSAEEKAAVREKHGLDRPMGEQYVEYWGGLLQGDLGYSYRQGRSVAEMIGEKLPWTVLLSCANIVFSTFIGVIFGTIAAWRRGKATDVVCNNIFVFLRSMPSFWLGMILIAIFGAELGWLPIYGAESQWASYTGMDRVVDILQHLAMPLITSVVLSVSSIYFTMRYSMIDVLGEDYITMAKLKGLSQKKIRYRHAMRNAMIPVSTVVMMNLGYMVGGSTVIETVFSYPGTGRLLYEAVTNRDYPLIQGCFLIITVCVIAANVISDMLYPLLDPKVK
jgi:peptide/nickel transport system permease protein